MLTFLKKIRRSLIESGFAGRPASPFGRYMLYAIGEIALVVIGILIALQINNRNEAQKIKQQERNLFSKILIDLQSDSIMISGALIGSKKHHDLHYHLYDEMKGRAAYDSTLEYGRLRWTVPFNPVVKENYQSFIDDIINEKVRDGLNVYFRSEERVSSFGLGQFIRLQLEYVRPYLTSNNISDLDAAFSTPRYGRNDPNNMLSYEALKAQFNTPEFGQILFELRAKTAASIQLLNALREANNELQKTIRLALEEQ